MVVLDASVVLKWMLADPTREPDTESAILLVQAVVRGRLDILQPMHWLVETAAVLARLSPGTALQDVGMLSAMQFPVWDEPSVMQRATELAIETGHHLFDTLYHAVALEHPGAFLVTADLRYLQKAERYGSVLALADAGTMV